MKTFRALTTSVSVEIHDDVIQAELAHAIMAPYPDATDAEVHYELCAHELRRNGHAVAASEPEDVVPLFEMDLYEQVVARAGPGWLLHAAAVDIGGAALVLCGPSGAGKTTLTLALAGRGYRLQTEEVVWIDRTGLVRGLPRPLHVPADAIDRAPIPPTWPQLPYTIRARDGGLRENVLVVPPQDALQHGALELRAILRIGHGPEWPSGLQTSAPRVALERLWARSLRQDDAGLAAATDILRIHRSYLLWSTSQTEALDLLAPLLK